MFVGWMAGWLVGSGLIIYWWKVNAAYQSVVRMISFNESARESKIAREMCTLNGKENESGKPKWRRWNGRRKRKKNEWKRENSVYFIVKRRNPIKYYTGPYFMASCFRYRYRYRYRFFKWPTWISFNIYWHRISRYFFFLRIFFHRSLLQLLSAFFFSFYFPSDTVFTHTLLHGFCCFDFFFALHSLW